MTSFSMRFGKPNKKGQRVVYINVHSGSTKKLLNTNIKVTDADLSRNRKTIINTEKAAAVEQINHEVQKNYIKLATELVGEKVSAEYIVERVIPKHAKIDFFCFAEEWLEKSGVKSKKNYSTMLNRLERFLGCRSLPFHLIDYTLLRNFELSLVGCERAKSMYLGQIRHLYREAMRAYNSGPEQVISYDPFLSYRVPRQKIKKGVRSLTLEQLLRIYEYDYKKENSKKPNGLGQIARDCFILSFCLMGMNSADLYNASDNRGGVLRYNRTKTKDRRTDGAYIEVNIHPFIQPLVWKYRDDTRAFNFHRRYADAAAFNAYLNRGLKKVGEQVGIPNLQFYQARHTFATLSRNLMRFNKNDVDEALNHVGRYEIADIYIEKDFSIINDNNKKLIETVFAKYM